MGRGGGIPVKSSVALCCVLLCKMYSAVRRRLCGVPAARRMDAVLETAGDGDQPLAIRHNYSELICLL